MARFTENVTAVKSRICQYLANYQTIGDGIRIKHSSNRIFYFVIEYFVLERVLGYLSTLENTNN